MELGKHIADKVKKIVDLRVHTRAVKSFPEKGEVTKMRRKLFNIHILKTI